jgi:hypothetical protein
MSIFQKNAINNNPDYFHADDEFTLLGNIEINNNKIVLAYNVHIWGEAQRATCRFLLFNENGKLLGMYPGLVFNPEEIKIEGNKIIFPISPEYGNIIDFNQGIPKKIWIDGEIYLYQQ